MMTRFLTPALLLVTSFTALGQAHVHGQGKAFIAQENNLWMVNLTLPSADVLGFEHAPENNEQHETIKTIKAMLSDPGNVVALQGTCSPGHPKLKLPEVSEHHDHKEHHDHEAHHDHDEKHEQSHSDVELTYEFTCSDEVARISFPILKSLPSIEQLSIELFTDKGQGATQISQSTPFIIL